VSPSARETRPSYAVPAIGLAVIAFAYVAFPPWADDWDGLGFLASVHRFDMASFAPHPPGYPVYVALLKAMALVSLDAIGAARLVACLSCGVTFALLVGVLCDAAGSPVSPRACALGAAFVCLTPLAFHSFSGVGSEAPAMAFAALALRAVTWRGSDRARLWMLGLAVGLGCGVRLSWLPFYAPFILLLPRPLWLRATLVGKLGGLAWAIPLVLLVGPTTLLALYRTHLGGHMTRWGGTALTDPSRGRLLARDLLSDGFGAGFDPLGVALFVVVGVALVLALALAVRSHRRLLDKALLVTLPYLLWITLGQNLREQPRHMLPIVATLSLGLVFLVLVHPSALVRVFALPVLLTLVGGRTLIDALERHAVPPPGAQLVALVASMNSEPQVFAGPSARFFDGSPALPTVHAVGSLGDAILALSRVDHPGPVTLLTSELTDLTHVLVPLVPVAHLCRPPRLDRRTPCLDVYATDTKALLGQ